MNVLVFQHKIEYMALWFLASKFSNVRRKTTKSVRNRYNRRTACVVANAMYKMGLLDNISFLFSFWRAKRIGLVKCFILKTQWFMRCVPTNTGHFSMHIFFVYTFLNLNVLTSEKCDEWQTVKHRKIIQTKGKFSQKII